MGGEATVVSCDDRLRLFLLEMATEDCYSIIELSGNLEEQCPGLTADERFRAANEMLVRLVDEGLIRVHRGEQCNGNAWAVSQLNLTRDEIRVLSESDWVYDKNVGAEIVSFCAPSPEVQDRVMAEYSAAWRKAHGETQ